MQKIEFIKNNTQPLFHINQKCIRHYKKKESQYVVITNIFVHNFNGYIDYFYRYHYNNNHCNGYAFESELSEIITTQPLKNIIRGRNLIEKKNKALDDSNKNKFLC